MTPTAEAPAPQVPRASVVIVSFNRVESLRRSLAALGNAHQVIVVDNGSRDGAASINAEFSHPRYSRLPKNFGFTKALNIGLRSAEGEYILCLHDDTIITAEAVSRLADFLEARADVGAVAPLLTDDSGNPLPQCRALPSPGDPDPEPTLPPESEKEGDEIQVECVSGAAIMFRSFFLRSVRQMDEHYGTYGSSIDICAHMRRAGKKVVILRGATAIHEALPSPMPQSAIEGDRAAGTAVFLGKHNGLVSGLIYRLKTALAALFTLRFSVLAGVLSGQKIDGTG